jgi:hypothetical protein
VNTHRSTLWHLNFYLTLRKTVKCNKQILNHSYNKVHVLKMKVMNLFPLLRVLASHGVSKSADIALCTAPHRSLHGHITLLMTLPLATNASLYNIQQYTSRLSERNFRTPNPKVLLKTHSFSVHIFIFRSICLHYKICSVRISRTIISLSEPRNTRCCALDGYEAVIVC